MIFEGFDCKVIIDKIDVVGVVFGVEEKVKVFVLCVEVVFDRVVVVLVE